MAVLREMTAPLEDIGVIINPYRDMTVAPSSVARMLRSLVHCARQKDKLVLRGDKQSLFEGKKDKDFKVSMQRKAEACAGCCLGWSSWHCS